MAQATSEIQPPAKTVENWQGIVDILAQICQTPAALVMRVTGPDIEVFVSSRSEGNPYLPGSKEHLESSGLYCETVIRSREKLLVPDALADPAWEDNPDVALNMVSYMGFPVLLPDGRPFGTICILDNQRNAYAKVFEELMLKFKALIEADLELVYMNQVLGDRNRKLSDYLMELQALRGVVPVCSNCKAIRDADGEWHALEHYFIRHPEAEFTHGMCPKCMKKLYPDIDTEA